MPARTGDQYIAGLKDNQPEVYLSGERVKDVTTHPALCNAVRTMAQLYDMQHDPALRDEMTYSSPTTGDPVGLSFITPGTPEDLDRRRTMMTHWARHSAVSGDGHRLCGGPGPAIPTGLGHLLQCLRREAGAVRAFLSG